MSINAVNSNGKVTAGHLKKTAYLYVRQSTLRQVFENTESTQRQYGLRQRAVALGWPAERIEIIDCDQGQSGATTTEREGFQKLVAEVGLGKAGIVMGLEVSRLARNCADWHRLLEICALSGTLILDEDGLYDPAHFNDRLLLGLKGTMSEAELHVLKARLRGGILSKAQRGELRIPLPAGLVYDPAGWIVSREGVLWIHQAPVILGDSWITSPIPDYQSSIGKHVLINAGGSPEKARPWFEIRDLVLKTLRDSEGRRMLLTDLVQTVRGIPAIKADFIEDTLRMMASMGVGSIDVRGEKIWYGLSPLIHGDFDRKDYLSTFSDELLAQSNRVDFLIRHTGTVGSFREELLRGFLRKCLPGKFQVSTGFIEDCGRQLDIIVWDGVNYAPLFRENEVVVVPRESVRAIVEVKTVLDTGTLDQALEILYEATTRHPPVVPIFQGVFAFEQGYRSDLSIAQRIKDFSSAREPLYFFQVVTAVCVARYHFIFQINELDDKNAGSWPKPCLYGLSSEWPGDPMTPAFVGYLMAHLDLPQGPKQTLTKMFRPILNELKRERLLQLFGDDWIPRWHAGDLKHVATPQGARNYVQRVTGFYEGTIVASEIPLNAPAGN